jgi:hypothetical protein
LSGRSWHVERTAAAVVGLGQVNRIPRPKTCAVLSVRAQLKLLLVCAFVRVDHLAHTETMSNVDMGNVTRYPPCNQWRRIKDQDLTSPLSPGREQPCSVAPPFPS